MKISVVAVLAVGLFFAPAAKAWNCPKGQHWVQKSGQTNVEVGSCVPDTPTPPTPKPVPDPGKGSSSTSSSTSNSNASSNASSSSTSSASQRQSQGQQQSQTATGGNASSAATNNGNGSNNSSFETNIKIPVSTAYAPNAAATVTCFKGFGVGAQLPMVGGSFGAGKIDENCAILETARSFALAGSKTAYCKTMLTDKYAKQAKVTLEDCLVIPVVIGGNQPIIIAPSAPVVVSQPLPAVLPVSKVTEIGTFQMNLIPGSGICPAPHTLVTPEGKVVLDKAASAVNSVNFYTKVIVVGNARNSVAAMRYLTRSVNKNMVLLQVDDSKNNDVSVSVSEE